MFLLPTALQKSCSPFFSTDVRAPLWSGGRGAVWNMVADRIWGHGPTRICKCGSAGHVARYSPGALSAQRRVTMAPCATSSATPGIACVALDVSASSPPGTCRHCWSFKCALSLPPSPILSCPLLLFFLFHLCLLSLSLSVFLSVSLSLSLSRFLYFFLFLFSCASSCVLCGSPVRLLVCLCVTCWNLPTARGGQEPRKIRAVLQAEDKLRNTILSEIEAMKRMAKLASKIPAMKFARIGKWLRGDPGQGVCGLVLVTPARRMSR